MNPLISVITPYRDAECFLPVVAASLQAQTYAHWECLLVNHCSLDGGPAWCDRLVLDDARFRCFHEPDSRPLPALPRNRAIREVRGSLVCFLDVDDVWHPEKLERQLAFHHAEGLELSVTAYGRFPCSGLLDSAMAIRAVKCVLHRYPPRQVSLWRLRLGNPIPMLTAMINQELLVKLQSGGGPFELLHHEDHLLWIQLYRFRPQLRYGCLPEVLAYHRRHGGNLTLRRWYLLLWIYRVHAASGLSASAAALVTVVQLLNSLVASVRDRLHLKCGAGGARVLGLGGRAGF